MRSVFVTHSALPALGMTSVVLGIISLLLGFLPVLGVPLGVIGLVCGVLGVGAAFFSISANLRWSLAGVAVCGLALGVNAALTMSPPGYIPERNALPPWEPPPNRPSNPPPARRGVDWGHVPRSRMLPACGLSGAACWQHAATGRHPGRTMNS